MKTLCVLALAMAMLLLSGCGAFWESQGEASRTQAQAALRRAEAERQSAQAQIIDAESRGALAQSQARALTTAMDANADLTRQALRLADNGEYVAVLAAVALAALVLAIVVVIWQGGRPATVASPAQGQVAQMITIETARGVLRLVQEPDESWSDFLAQAEALAAANDVRLLGGAEVTR